MEKKLPGYCWDSNKTIVSTLPETNIAHEIGWFEDDFPFGKVHFQVLC